jgi:hypothetical protein
LGPDQRTHLRKRLSLARTLHPVCVRARVYACVCSCVLNMCVSCLWLLGGSLDDQDMQQGMFHATC